MNSQKYVSGTARRAVATALVISSLLLPFKAMAEQPEQAKGPELSRQVTAQMFYQYRKGEGHEAGAGLDARLGIGAVNLDLGVGIAGNLEKGSILLENAGAKLTFPLVSVVSATGYAQRSRFLGGQNAVGGAFHAKFDPVVLHAGAEYDLITRAVPVFVGADRGVGPIDLSGTVILPVVPGQNHPNLGGTVKITWKTKVANFFVRVFGMMDPSTRVPLAGNVQTGIEIPLQ